MEDDVGRLGKAVRSEDSLEALLELRNVLADAMAIPAGTKIRYYK